MSHQDIMKEWFKTLPPDQPSPDFAGRVMNQVMSEWRLNPVKYQPMITKKGWWTLAFITLLLTSVLFVLHSSLPTGAETTIPSNTLMGIDLSRMLAPFNQLFVKLNNISPAVAIGALAIIALWFFDQLFIKLVRH